MSFLVAVIIPTYNRAALLARAIDSVFAQTYPHWQLIVVDDGSTDNTAAVVAGYGGRVRTVVQQHQGPAAARNAGIAAAHAPLVAFLDSDDWFVPDKLARQVAAMAEQPAYAVSHTQELWYREGRLLRQRPLHRKRHGDIFDHCLELCAVSMSTVVMRAEIFTTVGLFDPTLPCCEDYDFWLRVSRRYPFLLVDAPLTEKEGGRPDQVSARFRVGMDRFRIRSLLELLHREPLSCRQRRLVYRQLSRKCEIYGNGCLKHGRAIGHHYLHLAAVFAGKL